MFLKKHVYECHITFDITYKEEVIKACEGKGWKSSWIDRDPVMGEKVFVYATRHSNSLSKILFEMAGFCILFPESIILRKKIEKIVYDTKSYDRTSIGEESSIQTGS